MNRLRNLSPRQLFQQLKSLLSLQISKIIITIRAKVNKAEHECGGLFAPRSGLFPARGRIAEEVIESSGSPKSRRFITIAALNRRIGGSTACLRLFLLNAPGTFSLLLCNPNKR